jgi:hypothetical protein
MKGFAHSGRLIEGELATVLELPVKSDLDAIDLHQKTFFSVRDSDR